jgi:penicillin-binding protein A
MIGFFTKRPRLGLLAAAVIFVTGGVAAHQTHTRQPRGKEPALSIARPKVIKAPDWRDKLDLGQATREGKRIVQVLPDGTRVSYTLDPDLQKWALDYLKAQELPYSAMFLFEIESGRTLLMAGHSEANPKVDSEQLCLTPWAPTASVFKLVTASALLDAGVSSETTVCYHGGMHGLKRHHIVDNPKIDKSCNSLSYAIAKSVNPVMGKLAARHLTQEALQTWSYRFGYNRPIPFELAVQPSRALIPETELERARVAAGFWQTESSPLHGAVIASVAATRGLLKWPHIVEEVRQADGRTVIPSPPEATRVLGRSTADELSRMMLATTTMGTARRAFVTRGGKLYLQDTEVAGKTGSLSRSKPFLHYSWFVGFAPVAKPKVAFAVLLGNPEKWKIKAHTAAREMLSRYFHPKPAVPETRRSPAVAAIEKPAPAKHSSHRRPL